MLTTFRLFSTFFLGLATFPASAVIIDISYEYDTSGFFSENTRDGSAARATMEAAAEFYSDILTDSLAPIESNLSANNNYEVDFTHPSGFNRVVIPFLQLPADTIRVYVGSRNLGSTLGLASIGNTNVSGDPNTNFVNTATLRGQNFGTESDPRAEIAPWGGYITFNNRTDGLRGFWNYDHSAPPGFNNDLYSTAIHEIGHILGVGTSDSYHSFIPDGTTAFTGPRTTFFNDGEPLELTGDLDHVGDTDLETDPHPHTDGADEQVSAFLANRPIRTRHELTLLDAAILDDIGWDVNYLVAVPEPSAGLLSLSALALLAMRRRRG